MNTQGESHKHEEVTFFIDKAEKFETETRDITVRNLLENFAQEDPAQTTLVLKKGNELIKLTDLDQVVRLEDGMKFIVYYNTPTTVSSSPAYGPDKLVSELREHGHKAELVKGTDGNDYAIVKGFEVPMGRFSGRTIDLGLLAAADFPRTVGSSIHVLASPQLFDCGDSVPNVRNITASALGPDWRYWSLNFGWTGDKTVRRLLSQINGVFANA